MSQTVDPFSELNLDVHEKVTQKITVRRAFFGAIGLAIMVVGGLAVAVGYLLTAYLDVFAELLVVLGVGLCFGGYWVFSRGQRRRQVEKRG